MLGSKKEEKEKEQKEDEKSFKKAPKSQKWESALEANRATGQEEEDEFEDQEMDTSSVIMPEKQSEKRPLQTRERSPPDMQSPVDMEDEEEETEEESNPDMTRGETTYATRQSSDQISRQGYTGWQPPLGRYPPQGHQRQQYVGRSTRVIQTAMNLQTGQAAAYEYNMYEYAQRNVREMEGYDTYGFDTDDE